MDAEIETMKTELKAKNAMLKKQEVLAKTLSMSKLLEIWDDPEKRKIWMAKYNKCGLNPLDPMRCGVAFGPTLRNAWKIYTHLTEDEINTVLTHLRSDDRVVYNEDSDYYWNQYSFNLESHDYKDRSTFHNLETKIAEKVECIAKSMCYVGKKTSLSLKLYRSQGPLDHNHFLRLKKKLQLKVADSQGLPSPAKKIKIKM